MKVFEECMIHVSVTLGQLTSCNIDTSSLMKFAMGV